MRRKALRVDPPEPLAGVDEIVGRLACAKALEVRARGDEIRRVGSRRRQARLFGRVDRLFELSLVV
jgi:hypothetical protein